MTGIKKISSHRNLYLYGISSLLLLAIATLHMKLLLNIMVNVLKYTIVWYVIPICRCPDQPSCDVQMRRV